MRKTLFATTALALLSQEAPAQTIQLPRNTANALPGAPASPLITATPGSGAVAGPDGTAWMITPDGQVMQGDTVIPHGDNTSELVVVNGIIWGKDNGKPGHYSQNLGGWFQLSGNQQGWIPEGSATPPGLSAPPAPTVSTGPTTATPAALQPAPTVGTSPTTATPAALQPAPTVGTSPTTATPTTLQPVTAQPAPVAVGQVAQYSCSANTPNADPNAGGFAAGFLGNGQFLDPSGKPWAGRGVNVNDWAMATAQQSLLTDFPGANFIRLNINSYQDPSAYASFIDWATSNGIVVEIDDHTGVPSQTPAFSGDRLTQETSFFSAMAAAYKTNPYVWFESQNEALGGNLAAEQQAVYDAVRNTGNENPVGLNVMSGGIPGFQTSENAAWLNTTSNTFMTIHSYGWYGTDNFNGDVNAALQSLITNANFSSQQGKMPIMIDEYGNSSTGYGIDSNGTAAVNAVQTSGLSTAAWAWAPGGSGDALLSGQGTGSLTAYGTQVESYIQSNGPTPGCAIDPTPASVATNQVIPAADVATAMIPQTGAALPAIQPPAGLQ